MCNVNRFVLLSYIRHDYPADAMINGIPKNFGLDKPNMVESLSQFFFSLFAQMTTQKCCCDFECCVSFFTVLIFFCHSHFLF